MHVIDVLVGGHRRPALFLLDAAGVAYGEVRADVAGVECESKLR